MTPVIHQTLSIFSFYYLLFICLRLRQFIVYVSFPCLAPLLKNSMLVQKKFCFAWGLLYGKLSLAQYFMESILHWISKDFLLFLHARKMIFQQQLRSIFTTWKAFDSMLVSFEFYYQKIRSEIPCWVLFTSGFILSCGLVEQ